MPDDDLEPVQNPGSVRLTEIVDQRLVMYLKCRSCGRERIVEGLYYLQRAGDMSFQKLLARMRCTACGHKGISGELKRDKGARPFA